MGGFSSYHPQADLLWQALAPGACLASALGGYSAVGIGRPDVSAAVFGRDCRRLATCPKRGALRRRRGKLAARAERFPDLGGADRPVGSGGRVVRAARR